MQMSRFCSQKRKRAGLDNREGYPVTWGQQVKGKVTKSGKTKIQEFDNEIHPFIRDSLSAHPCS